MDPNVPEEKNIVVENKNKNIFLSPFKIAFLDKLFRTVRTFVPGTYVDQKMFIETVSPAELLAAMLTFVNLDVFMAQSMVV